MESVELNLTEGDRVLVSVEHHGIVGGGRFLENDELTQSGSDIVLEALSH